MGKKEKIIGSIAIFIIFTIFVVVGYIKVSPKGDNKDIFVEEKKLTEDGENISVYINGEVNSPGVYSLKSGSRVEELVKRAGGFTKEADNFKVNLAKKLKDEEQIIVHKKMGLKNNPDGVKYNSSEDTRKVNINTASLEELKTLDGIGDVLGKRIIDYREKNGYFSSVEDLEKVERISKKLIDKIRDKVEVY